MLLMLSKIVKQVLVEQKEGLVVSEHPDVRCVHCCLGFQARHECQERESVIKAVALHLSLIHI